MLNNTTLVVFPSSRSIRDYISKSQVENTLLPSIVSIDEFFKKVLYFKNKKYIDEEERFLYLREAVCDIELHKLGISSTFTAFLKQSDYIYRFFLELASEKVDIDTLLKYDTYEYYTEHLQILKKIKKNYLNILDFNNAIDKLNIDKYAILNTEYINKFLDIEIYFEGYFTKQEFDFIEMISKKILLKINFISTKYNQKSIEKFSNVNMSFNLDCEYKIDFTNKTFLESKKIISQVKNFDIKAFSSRINQIAYIKTSIVNSISNGIEASKIVLVLPDEKFVNLLKLFDYEKYFNFAMGLDIFNTKLYKIIEAIYLFISQDEIKNKNNIEFLNLDMNIINNLFVQNWNKVFSIKIFKEICQYFISLETNKELIQKFSEIIYKLNKIFFSIKNTILLKDAYKILFEQISTITLDDISSGKITVLGLLECRKVSFDTVIICDFNEHLIPKRNIKDKFLSTSLKQAVKLPTSYDRENLQKYYYDRLINQAKEVYISYVKNDTNQISRFANELFSKHIDSSNDDQAYDDNYRHILYTQHNLHHFNKDIILDIDLSQNIWSASSLKYFLQCKRKYYLKYIANIKEHDISLKPKAYELGNIVHKALELYYKQDILTFEKLKQIFDNIEVDNTFLILDLEVFKKNLYNFFLHEENLFKQRRSILNLEKSFSFKYKNIKLKGTIDRIDKVDNTYEVIDYKTSNSLKVDTKRTYEKSSDFQLEFYYIATSYMYKTKDIKAYYYDLNNIKLLEEIQLDVKIDLLEKIFEELKTKKVNFNKCEDRMQCMYCSYIHICNRN